MRWMDWRKTPMEAQNPGAASLLFRQRLLVPSD